MKYTLFLFCVFALQCCNSPSSKKEINHQFAETNGVANFKKVQMLGFTFNAQRDTAPSSSRQQD